VPGLGQLVQKRWLAGVSFFGATLLTLWLAFQFLYLPISNTLLFLALLLVWGSVFDAARYSFAPASSAATQRARTMRLGLLATLLVSLCVFIAPLTASRWYELWQIPGEQARPLLQPGDGILVQHLGEPIEEITRGDVVITQADYGPNIERAIGLPGDRVECRSNVLYVNGMRVLASQLPFTFTTPTPDFSTTVPSDSICLWRGVIGNYAEEDGAEHRVNTCWISRERGGQSHRYLQPAAAETMAQRCHTLQITDNHAEFH
jgi:signal peptidase I